jgi:hypothetical protein
MQNHDLQKQLALNIAVSTALLAEMKREVAEFHSKLQYDLEMLKMKLASTVSLSRDDVMNRLASLDLCRKSFSERLSLALDQCKAIDVADPDQCILLDVTYRVTDLYKPVFAQLDDALTTAQAYLPFAVA